MTRIAAALIVVATTAVAVGCGGGGQAATEGSNHGASATNPADDRPPGGKSSDIYLSEQPSRRPGGQKQGQAPIRNRAELCFKPGPLTTDAGESFSGIEPGQRFRGRQQVIKNAVRAALIPTVRAELRTAEHLADAKTASQIQRVKRAAHRGIRQLSRDPNLLVRGRVPGFERAQALVERYDLSRC